MSLIPKKLERGFEALLAPLVDWLIARRVNPNTLTTVGTVILLGSGVAFGMAEVRLGAVLLLVSGVFDMLDGRVARGGELTSKFGAFYDSTLDRVGEAALYTGIAIFFMTGGVPGWLAIPAVVIAVSALSFSLIVSYARARAEGLGLECKVGIGQRAERILGLGAPTLFFGAGPDGSLLLAIVTFLAVLALVTVMQRIRHVYKLTRKKRRTTQVRRAAPILAELQGKGKKW
ncbi:MAG: CDP-alcohol phosphatidyltransferase family protein [Gemmatimonadota bacterium]|nr:MAG: CDP-alcohol phosphatidyltransferase family protein [Gemmatimonadota bacterium]